MRSTAILAAYGASIIALSTTLTPCHAFTTSGPALLNKKLTGTSSSSSLFPRNNKAPLRTRLFAEGGPPQYDKIDATLIKAETVGKGSVMLHIGVSRNVDYEPGHVVALEMEDPSRSEINDDSDSDDDDDAVTNGGWMRGPYTVSRSGETSMDILIRIVGTKSEAMACAAPGTPLKIGGKFKVPILEGIRTEERKRVVMVSTGVGVGPCVGAIERALERNDNGGVVVFPPIELFACYRNEEEIVYGDHLDKLVERFGPDRLKWCPVVTSFSGRLSSSDSNLEKLFSVDEERNGSSDTHYHLIGNGQMVNEFKKGLVKGGVPEDCVTLEMYFNHKAEVSEEVVDRIASFVSKGVGTAESSVAVEA